MERLDFLPAENPDEINRPDINHWWKRLDFAPPEFVTGISHYHDLCDISPGALIDQSRGPVILGAATRICHGAVVQGPVSIGENCLIGNGTFIRGNTIIGDRVKIGFATEIKGAIIEDRVTIGPQCFIADSIIERDAYLGAQVRTSNHRLDGQCVQVLMNDKFIDTGRDKLGCFIGAESALGIQVIILPGRVVSRNTLLGPRIIVERNLPAGRYFLRQTLLAK